MTESEREELKSFLERAFWIVGSSCFIWETLVIAALLRVTPVELPFLGECSHGDAIILTLTFFWPVLLALHWLVHMYQSVTTGAAASARFPGLLRDLEIPKRFARFRILLFVVLVVWPTLAHEVITVRSFSHMMIVYNHQGEAYLPSNHPVTESTVQAQRAQVDTDLLKYRGVTQLGWLCSPLDAQGNKIPGQWRWLHWRDENIVQVHDSENAPARWAVKPEHWPTAFPFFQPWWFLIAGIGFALSACWMTVRVIFRK
jgi:hypothetical protein